MGLGFLAPALPHSRETGCRVTIPATGCSASSAAWSHGVMVSHAGHTDTGCPFGPRIKSASINPKAPDLARVLVARVPSRDSSVPWVAGESVAGIRWGRGENFPG